MSTNSTSQEDALYNLLFFSGKSVENKIEKTIAYCIILLLSIFGNTFIICTIYKDNRLKSTPNFLVANMAGSDFISTLFTVPVIVSQINFEYKWLIGGVVTN